MIESYDDVGTIRNALAFILDKLFSGREDREPLSDDDREELTNELNALIDDL